MFTRRTFLRQAAGAGACASSFTGRSLPGGERSAPRSNTRTKSAAVTLFNRHLLLPYYIAPGNGALAALSSDNGVAWSTVQVPDTEGFVGDEWDVLEVEPGRLVDIFQQSQIRGRDGWHCPPLSVQW